MPQLSLPPTFSLTMMPCQGFAEYEPEADGLTSRRENEARVRGPRP